jgi:hypothetical protein
MFILASFVTLSGICFLAKNITLNARQVSCFYFTLFTIQSSLFVDFFDCLKLVFTHLFKAHCVTTLNVHLVVLPQIYLPPLTGFNLILRL